MVFFVGVAVGNTVPLKFDGSCEIDRINIDNLITPIKHTHIIRYALLIVPMLVILETIDTASA